MYKNCEGYKDITAGKAISFVSKEEKKRQGDVSLLIEMIKRIISFTGFELVGRIHLKDKVTGKEYK